jgi:lipopolysaccharide export system permease protein
LKALTDLPLVLALSTFIAVLVALSRAFRDSEMVVWFASGQSLAAWIRPVLGFALPVAAGVAALSLFVSPWAERMIADSRQRFEHRDDVTKVTAGRFIESSESDRVFFVENLDVEGSRVQSVFASQRVAGHESVIVAAQGVIETHADGARFLVLRDGRRYEGSPGVAGHRVLEFGSYAIRLDPQGGAEAVARGPGAAAPARRHPRSMPTTALLADPSARNLGELLGRISLPIVTCVLAVLAVPLAHVNPRVGRSANLIFATLLALLYLNGVLILQGWVQRERISFGTALLAGHAIAIALAAVLYSRRIHRWRWIPRLPLPLRAPARAA